MRKPLVILVALAVVGAACGSSDGGETTPATDSSPDPAPEVTDPPVTDPAVTDPPVTDPAVTDPPVTDPAATDPPSPEVIDLFSDDGELGASYTTSAGGPEVTIRLLEPSEWPVEIAAGGDAPGVKIYELEPDGATFDEPVTVTRRVDITSFDGLGLGPFDVPLVTMLTQNADGAFEVLDELSLLRIGPDLFVSGTTTHFSPIFVSNEQRIIPLDDAGGGDPPIVPTELSADEFIDAWAEAFPDVVEAAPGRVVTERWLGPEEVLEYVQKLIEEQAGEDESDTAGPETARPMYEFNEDGFVIESVPVPPVSQPLTPDEGGYRAERFGTQFPTIPVSLLPSTGALLGGLDATIGLTVYALALVVPAAVLPATEPPVTEPPVTEPSADDEAKSDCFMYLEMYPELIELDPSLADLCETDTDAARAIISGLLADVGE